MTAPANDDLANAILIAGPSGSVGPVTIDDATAEGSEIGSPHQTIWYYFLAGSDVADVYLSTQGSAAGDAGSGDGVTPPSPFGSLDTNIRVYEVATATPTYATLFGNQIAFNEDHDDDEWWAEVTFAVTTGNYYFFRVGTFDDGYTGTVILSWENVPLPPAPVCIDYPTWGLFASGEGSPVTPGGGEAAGYVEAGLNNLTFTNDPPDGSLIIAIARRYSYSGSLPSTGTMSGFGATWTRISYQEASGNLGDAFSEVWWAFEPTYTAGRARYTFPAGSDYDQTYSTVGYEVLTGFDPANPFREVQEYGPTSGTSASWSHVPSVVTPSSIIFTAFYSMDSALTDQAITQTFTDLDIHAASRETPPIGSGGSPVPVDPQRGTQEVFAVAVGPDFGFTFADTSNARTWWAVTLEIVADPECAGILQAYWGILAVPL